MYEYFRRLWSLYPRASTVGVATSREHNLERKYGLWHGRFYRCLCVLKLQTHGLTKGSGEVLVTGATGGVESIAVGILAKAGFHVVAATGKTDQNDFLRRLGAEQVISRAEANDSSGRPMLRGR